METLGFELLAIYHSHPKGPESPSETDLAEFAYPGVYTIIWFPFDHKWTCKAFWIFDGRFTETGFRIDDER
jgi:proteasome lid subunit RPN8/RPN11